MYEPCLWIWVGLISACLMTDKVFFPTAFHRDCTLHSATSGLNRTKQNARKHYDNSEQIEFLCSPKNCWWPNKVSSWNLTWFISRLIWYAPGQQYAQQDNLLWSAKVRILQLPAQISLKSVAQDVDPSLCLPPLGPWLSLHPWGIWMRRPPDLAQLRRGIGDTSLSLLQTLWLVMATRMLLENTGVEVHTGCFSLC